MHNKLKSLIAITIILTLSEPAFSAQCDQAFSDMKKSQIHLANASGKQQFYNIYCDQQLPSMMHLSKNCPIWKSQSLTNNIDRAQIICSSR